MKRPAHKLAHATCPYGQSSWADCDAAAAHRYGLCVAMVDAKPEPHRCTRWAQDEDGYCSQHFIARFEQERRKEREAQTQLQLQSAIAEFIEHTALHPSIWDGDTRLPTAAESTRGLHGIGAPVVERPAPRVRKPPHRLTELA